MYQPFAWNSATIAKYTDVNSFKKPQFVPGRASRASASPGRYQSPGRLSRASQASNTYNRLDERRGSNVSMNSNLNNSFVKVPKLTV